jgi:hypothetical protein
MRLNSINRAQLIINRNRRRMNAFERLKEGNVLKLSLELVSVFLF